MSVWQPDGPDSQSGEWSRIESLWGRSNYTVCDLEKNTEYRFQIGIEKDDGTLSHSDEIAIRTGDDDASVKMREFQVDGTRAVMSWEPIPNAVYNIYITGAARTT